MEFTRFDVPGEVRAVMDEAVKRGFVDHLDLFAVALNEADRTCPAWDRVVDDLVQTAWENRNVDPEGHRAVAERANHFWKVRSGSKDHLLDPSPRKGLLKPLRWGDLGL